MKKHPKKHIYTKQQNQNQPAKRRNCLFFKIHYLSEQKKIYKYMINMINKVYLVKQWAKEKGGKVVTFFKGSSFYMKNILKCEIFNGKKSYK